MSNPILFELQAEVVDARPDAEEGRGALHVLTSPQWNVRMGKDHFQGVVGQNGKPFDVNEFRTQLSLHGAIFYDLGNVFPRVKDMSFSELRHTAGGGLRYTMSFGALRLDWARILDVRAGEPRSRLHFGFGYAF